MNDGLNNRLLALSSILFCLLLCVLLLSSCSQETDRSKNDNKTEELDFTKTMMPPNEIFPEGYFDVVFGEVHFQIPEPYVGYNKSKEDFFDINILYPSMKPFHRLRSDKRSERHDIFIRLLFEYKDDGFSDHNEVIEKYYERKWLDFGEPSSEYVGLIQHAKPGQWFYQVDDVGYQNMKGAPIAFFCGTFGGGQDSPETLNYCNWHIHIEDVAIRVAFKQSHLRDWQGLIEKVNKFLNEILVSDQQILQITK